MIIPGDIEYLPAIALRAGEVSLLYEEGRIRYLRAGNTDLLRMIYFALRDHKWDTIPYSVEGFSTVVDEDHFEIKFVAVYHHENIRFSADILIRGSADNSIEFSFRGEAGSEFLSNRIGICIHHPISTCSGREVHLIDSTGKPAATSSFPVNISPHQPLKDIREMQWNTTDGKKVRLKFEGEIFETEDQRNWTDDSFKTYCIPLERPFPITTKAGSSIFQKVTVQVDKGGTAGSPPAISKAESKVSFPALGYARRQGQERLAPELTELFKDIPFDAYRVELHLGNYQWKTVLDDATAESDMLDVPLQLSVFFDEFSDKETDELIRALSPVKDQVSSVLILSGKHKIIPGDDYAKIFSRIRNTLKDIPIGYGTDTYFAELNRNRPGRLPADFLGFSLHPQVHMSDNRSILENLGSQHHTLETIKSFAPALPVQISPVTLSARFNPDKKGERVLLPADPRQYSSFAAWWTIKTIVNLADAQSVVFYQLTGDNGLVNIQEGDFKTSAVFDLLREIKRFQPRYIIRSSNWNQPLSDVILEDQEGRRLHISTDLPEPTIIQ
ncbi:MAG TPA: hypothetical protein VK628_01470 [Flavitalea sp.]|nr:hypothetical protein [Flavitalea sp.]